MFWNARTSSVFQQPVSASLCAEEQHIQYSTDTRDYRLTYDKVRLRGYDMQELVWLSPWYDPGKDEPFQIVFSLNAAAGNVRINKFFVAEPLEAGPVQIQRPTPGAFEPRAKRNLERTRGELDELARMIVPPVLEPVKQYLIETLSFSYLIAGLRYEYIKTGNVVPLGRALCDKCPCGPEQETLLEQLRNTDDFVQRLVKSFNGWPNEMLDCYKRGHSYPVAAWDAFLHQFGVSESHTEKSPE